MVCQEAEQELGLQSTKVKGQCPSATGISLNTIYTLLPDSETAVLVPK